MYRVSDFHIAANIIKRACKARHTAFIDLVVDFDEDGNTGIKNNIMYLGAPETFGTTNANIIHLYFTEFSRICGIPLWECPKRYEVTLAAVLGYINKLTHSDSVLEEARTEDPVALRLYQVPLAWIAIRDLICPAFQVAPNNVKVIAFGSPYACTRLVNVDDQDFPREAEDEKFVFLNTDIEYAPCRDACLLMAAIDAQELNSRDVLKEVFESELLDSLVGIASLSYKDDEEVDDFLTMLATYADVDNFSDHLVSKNAKAAASASGIEKFAQGMGSDTFGGDGPAGTWWFLGLMEEMLEPARGSDWTTHAIMKPWFDEIQNKIDVAREEKGRDGLTFEGMLRAKDPEMDVSKVVLLEKVLGSDRIW